MKIAGLTWWRNNYGSILQAYALQSYLNSQDDIEYDIVCQFGKKIASIDNLKDKIKRLGFRETIRKAFWKFFFRKLRKRNASLQRFIDEKLVITGSAYSEETIAELNKLYDAFICGSDQVWNPALVSTDSIYWLPFVDKDKYRIAYAPSIGITKVDAKTASAIKKNLERFDAVSCREESGTELLNRICGKKVCTTVLDPTLLVERKLWDDICGPRRIGEKYIFAYMLRGNSKQRRYIEAYAKKHHLKVVTMPFLDYEKIDPYDFVFGDIKIWDADPSAFINLIRYAECVFTDSFHSMVFSIIYHRPFYVFPKIGKAQVNRQTGLMDLFQIDSRIINEADPDHCERMGTINWDRVDSILYEKRAVSQRYLTEALDHIKGEV